MIRLHNAANMLKLTGFKYHFHEGILRYVSYISIKLFLNISKAVVGFPRWLSNKESACQPKDPGSTPGLGRSPGEGKDNPVQYSCLENPMDRGAQQAIVPGVAKSGTRLSNQTAARQWLLHRCADTGHNSLNSTHKWVHVIACKSYSIKWTFKNVSRDFPSGPMTKPLHSQYRGPGFIF